MRDNALLLVRRGLAWWIDGFLVAVIVIAVRAAWLALADPAFNVEALLTPLVFFAYRVALEGWKNTSLGKWSLRLEILATRRGFIGATLRNLWLLIPLIALTGPTWTEHTTEIVVAVLALSVLAVGQTPFDLLAGAMVESRGRLFAKTQAKN
ncbi:RDD family protein [Corynebacterium phoceense]